MRSRFTRVFAFPNDLYSSDSPVIVSAGALLQDQETGNIVAQLKFQGVSFASIRALKITLGAYDVTGAKLKGVKEYQYLDLNVRNGQFFGANKAILLPEAVTRSISIEHVTVVLSDHSVVDIGGQWEALPARKWLHPELGDHDLVEEYRLFTSDDSIYAPQEAAGLWQCACGQWNGSSSDAASCTACRQKKQSVFEPFNAKYLREKREQRLAEIERLAKKREAQERAEAEQRAARRRETMQRLKPIFIALTVLLSLLAGFLVFTQWIIPAQQYKKADRLLLAESYTEARLIYQKLADKSNPYKDSEERVKETYYQEGISLISQQRYEDACAMLEMVGDYKNALPETREARYRLALTMVTEGRYKDAYDIFNKLGNYKESAAYRENLILPLMEQHNDIAFIKLICENIHAKIIGKLDAAYLAILEEERLKLANLPVGGYFNLAIESLYEDYYEALCDQCSVLLKIINGGEEESTYKQFLDAGKEQARVLHDINTYYRKYLPEGSVAAYKEIGAWEQSMAEYERWLDVSEALDDFFWELPSVDEKNGKCSLMFYNKTDYDFKLVLYLKFADAAGNVIGTQTETYGVYAGERNDLSFRTSLDCDTVEFEWSFDFENIPPKPVEKEGGRITAYGTIPGSSGSGSGRVNTWN